MAKLSFGKGGTSDGGKPVVVVTGVSEMVARLKELDAKLVTRLRKELKDTAKGTASRIQSQIQTTPPLSGMGGGDHRTDWGGAVATVSASFAGSKRKDVTPLLKIKVDSPKTAIGYMIAEKAGSRGPSGSGPRGAQLIAMLTDRLGTIRGKGKGAQRQIAWRYFWSERKDVARAAVEVVNRFEKISTGELNA
jgi:hypothetical protein